MSCWRATFRACHPQGQVLVGLVARVVPLPDTERGALEADPRPSQRRNRQRGAPGVPRRMKAIWHMASFQAPQKPAAAITSSM